MSVWTIYFFYKFFEASLYFSIFLFWYPRKYCNEFYKRQKFLLTVQNNDSSGYPIILKRMTYSENKRAKDISYLT